jgi:hypothetical protein
MVSETWSCCPKSLGQLSSRERSVLLRGLALPEKALHLEAADVRANVKKLATTSLTLSVKVQCKELQRDVAAKVLLRVHARCNALPADSCSGSGVADQGAAEAKRAALTNEETHDAKKQGIDIVCVTGDTSDPTLQDRFLLVGRILPTSSLLLLGEVEELKPDSPFQPDVEGQAAQEWM